MNFDEVDKNVFTKIFNSDPLKLKEFLQNSLRNLNIENVKFITGGAMGLAFEWGDKVLKITSDASEKISVEKMLNKNLPGFAEYYWIKEVDLPKNSPGKTTKAYIICLDKLKVLDDNEKEIAATIYMLFRSGYLNDEESEKQLNDKLYKIYNWIISDEEVYGGNDYDREKYYVSEKEKGITKKALFGQDGNNSNLITIWKEFGEDRFKEFTNQYIKIRKTAKVNRIPTDDLHQDNLGYKGNTKVLVAFDCMEK